MAMLLLWILSLAASVLLLATGEVVDNFESCSQFFLDRRAPEMEISNSARICQFYKSKYRFATMYDKKRRIPIFSAYKYQPGKGRRKNMWKIEPQLALPEDRNRKSMALERTCKIDRKHLKNSQVVSEDYKGTPIYDRGHLTPVSHQPDQGSKDATFTLTNIVPQFHQLNQRKWKEYESNITDYTRGCRDAYVLVGAVPGRKLLNRRVNIPSHIWAAGCCVTQDNRKRSWAVIAKNDQNKVEPHNLRNLEEQLAKLYKKKEINLFNHACYSGGTWPKNFTEQMQPDYKFSSLLV